ncbi:MAG: GerMN domain-containing protein [Patescibacteria group bacterium]
MKHALIIIIILAILTVAAIIGLRLFTDEDTWLCENGEWVKHGNPSAPMPENGCGEEEPEITNFIECEQAGYAVLESYPRQCQTPDGDLFTEDIGNELEKIDLIRIDYPRPNQEIISPLVISGEARGTWFFEASFPVKLYDDSSTLLTSAIASTTEDWMTEDFVPFQAMLTFSAPVGTYGKLILEKDNPSDLPENADELIIPIKFGEVELEIVKVYFNNELLDPEVSCDKVFPVERIVSPENPKEQAILELLKGETDKEKTEGYMTSINPNVELQFLTIDEGVARVDFDEQLEYQVGGSCRVAAISAQIRNTLLQFPDINEVIISVNGRTEDILQP